MNKENILKSCGENPSMQSCLETKGVIKRVILAKIHFARKNKCKICGSNQYIILDVKRICVNCFNPKLLKCR